METTKWIVISEISEKEILSIEFIDKDEAIEFFLMCKRSNPKQVFILIEETIKEEKQILSISCTKDQKELRF